MADEYFDVVDENGHLLGFRKLRNEVHRDGDWHRTVHIWVINGDSVLLQRRSHSKDLFPDMLDVSAAGHVDAGEDYLTAAVREIKEELDITVDSDTLEYIKTLKRQNKSGKLIDNEITAVYVVKTDKNVDEIRFCKDEISEVRYFTIAEITEMYMNKHPDLLLSDGEYKVLKSIII